MAASKSPLNTEAPRILLNMELITIILNMAEPQSHLNKTEPKNPPQHSSHTEYFSAQQPQILLNMAALHILPTQQPLRFLLNKAPPHNPPQYATLQNPSQHCMPSESSRTAPHILPSEAATQNPQHSSPSESFSTQQLHRTFSMWQPLRILFNMAAPHNAYQHNQVSDPSQHRNL